MTEMDFYRAYLDRVADILGETETKVRHVRDAAYWGMPVNTPIEPGMKPVGKPGTPITSKPKTPASGSSAESAVQAVKPTSRPKPKVVLHREPRTVTAPDTTVMKGSRFSIKAAAEELKKIARTGSKGGKGTVGDPIDCGDDIEKAHLLLAEGKHVRLNTEMEVSLLIDKLAEEAAFAKERGEKMPDYDLCKVTVPGTNLFCLENKGIKRELMPQFSGQPVEGSYAESVFNDEKGESDVTDDFGKLLEEMGISVETKDVPVQQLKATQSQLVGAKVATIRKLMREGKIPDKPIYVTRDGYIIDGHHRWAAKMALDLEDGKLGTVDMTVKMIDADIGYALDLSMGFTEMAGIKPKATGAAADGVKTLARALRMAGIKSVHACRIGGTCN